MKLMELQIVNFGRLSDRKITLDEGINVVYGPNESGKTTLHTFIRGMFYGITRKRGRASKNDLYSSYEPWDNRHTYGGLLKFESSGKIFRLKRSFQKDNQQVELVCETDGEQLSVEHGDLNVLMGDISENTFINTVFVGQLKSETDDTLYDELRNYIANYEGAGDGELDIGKAQQLLKNQKKALENRNKEEIRKQDEQKKLLSSKMEYVRDELQNQQGQLAQLELEIKNQQTKETQPIPSARKRPSLLPGIILALLLVVVVLLKIPTVIKVVVAVLIGLIGCLGVLGIRKQRKKPREQCEVSGSKEQQQRLWKREQLQEQCEEKAIALQNIQEEYQEFSVTAAAVRAVDQELASIDLAMKTIEEIALGLQVNVEKDIRIQISEILMELTKGRYRAVDITKDKNIALNTKDHYIPLARTSRGTIEQVYFALRMAVSNILCTQEELPVILDDVFAMYDEERLQLALQWLHRKRQQTVIFTCHRREMELLEGLGIPFHKIELS